MEYIVLETDAPYLAPVPYRGKRNESSYIPLIAEKVGDIFGLSKEETGRITTENALKIFPN
jgi:TatD DNase family protein